VGKIGRAAIEHFQIRQSSTKLAAFEGFFNALVHLFFLMFGQVASRSESRRLPGFATCRLHPLQSSRESERNERARFQQRFARQAEEPVQFSDATAHHALSEPSFFRTGAEGILFPRDDTVLGAAGGSSGAMES